MTKPKHGGKRGKTEGAHHQATAKGPDAKTDRPPQSSSPPPASPLPSLPRRTDAALKPKAPLEVLVSRALDQELDWYFTYGEAALGRGDVALLPSYAAARLFASEELHPTAQDKALGLARTVSACLASLRDPHASVQRTAYTPRRWPEPLARAFQCVAPIAVRLALAGNPWPRRRSRGGLEEATATRLSAAIVAKSATVRVDRLRTEAERLLGRAVVAYARARAHAHEGGALGLA